MRQFEKNEWDYLHDVVLSATWDKSKKLSQSELEDLFEEFPEHITCYGRQSGGGIGKRRFGGAKELHKSRSNQFMTDTKLRVRTPSWLQ